MVDTDWGIEDPLQRGDSAHAVTPPAPKGPDSIVRHVLQVDDCRSPYLSTTERISEAKRWAGKSGAVWRTFVAQIESAELRWISRAELLEMLKAGKDAAVAWPRRSDLLAAQQYVEESAEHLIDFRSLTDQSSESVGAIVGNLFSKDAL